MTYCIDTSKPMFRLCSCQRPLPAFSLPPVTCALYPPASSSPNARALAAATQNCKPDAQATHTVCRHGSIALCSCVPRFLIPHPSPHTPHLSPHTQPTPPQGIYLAGGSTTGTLAVCSLPLTSRTLPEPSFLYHWLSNQDTKRALPLIHKMMAQYPYLLNMQVGAYMLHAMLQLATHRSLCSHVRASLRPATCTIHACIADLQRSVACTLRMSSVLMWSC